MNKERFKEAYTAALRECVTNRPDLYAWPVEQVPIVAGRMFAAMDKGSFSHEGLAYKLTCKRLGIPHTRKAIFAFWNEQQPQEATT